MVSALFMEISNSEEYPPQKIPIVFIVLFFSKLIHAIYFSWKYSLKLFSYMG
jgi:hypothetical protein